MDQRKTTTGAFQASMNAEINNRTAAAQVLVNNSSFAAKPLLNNINGNDHHSLYDSPGLGQQPISSPGFGQKRISNPGVAQQRISSPGVAQQRISSPGSNQAFLNKPASIAQALMKGPSASQALILGDRGGMLSMTDDNAMMNQILMTHSPDGREVDVKSLLCLVEDILNRATQQVDFLVKDTRAQTELEEKVLQPNFIAMLEALSYNIDRIAVELAYKALGGSDAHATTTAVFNLLSSYTWEAKLVLSLSAFALNYGEFWLLAQIYSTNQLAKSMAILRQLPSILEHTAPLKPRFDALNNLIQMMMDVTRCVVELKELPSTCIPEDLPVFASAMTHIPTAVYWTIRSMVSCAHQITILTSMSYEHVVSTTEFWELSSLAHKLKNIHRRLRQQLNFCYQYIEEIIESETYQTLANLFDTNVMHIDNMKVLKSLINAKDDKLSLLDGATKRQVKLDVLRKKNVLLLISSLNFSSDELTILAKIYNDSRVNSERLENQYEVVWIPIVEPSVLPLTDDMRTKFENLRSTMPWYSMEDPLLIQKPVIRFIKEAWHFRTKPILVVLDPQGKVVSPNAIHMAWIWGSSAFPFTSSREEDLWREETWRLELLVDDIDQMIHNWIKEDKYIFLYGGDDVEWVRRFAAAARSVATAVQIPLEMVYVGKNCKGEQVKKVTQIINAEELSNALQDPAKVWFFWTRLQSMLFSKIHLGKVDDDDQIMQQIKKLLSYDKEGGWAMLSKGSNIVVNAYSTTVLHALDGYDEWKVNVLEKGFHLAFKEYHDRLLGVARPCSRFEFPHTIRIPDSMNCPECHHIMEKYTAFLCCHDEQDIPSSIF